MRRILIGAAHSGGGKTTVSLGLMRALKNRGLKVQPYKTGPDYIDTLWHKEAAGVNSCNLDAYMLDAAALNNLFCATAASSAINIIEGVMGLYDGYGTDPNYCSSAGLAKSLDCPIILVVEGKAVSTSIAATVLGFKTFDPKANIAGVIVNRVNSDSHYALLKTAIEKYCAIPVLGRLPNDPQLTLPSHALGLYLSHELAELESFWAALTAHMENYVDLDKILALSERPPVANTQIPLTLNATEKPIPCTIAIARDAAFQFYYPANLALLEQLGATLVEFSPLEDAALPECDGVFIGSGYPERFAAELAANKSMRASILAAHKCALPIYGECGGLLYLGDRLRIKTGECYPMVGALAGMGKITERLQQFGYCQAKAMRDTLFNRAGEVIRGHEFHYSAFETSLPCCYSMNKEQDGVVRKTWSGGYQVNNTFGSHVRLHFYQNPAFAQHFLATAHKMRIAYKEQDHG